MKSNNKHINAVLVRKIIYIVQLNVDTSKSDDNISE
jgi:hypothetical protein